jgi:hypothetical protein
MVFAPYLVSVGSVSEFGLVDNDGIGEIKLAVQLPLSGLGPLYAEFFHSTAKGIDMHSQR